MKAFLLATQTVFQSQKITSTPELDDKIISQLYFFKNVYYADDLAHINDRIKFKEYNNFYYVTNHNIKSKVTISYGPVSYNIEDANLLTQISNKWERYTIDLYNKLTNDYPFLKCARYSSTPLNIIPIIPIGELDIIWTRENIQYSDKSKKVILDTFDTVFEYMVANYKDKYIFDVFNFIVSIPKVHATYNKKFKTINLNKDQKHYDLEDIDIYATIIDESLASSAGNFLNVVRSIVRNKVVTDYNISVNDLMTLEKGMTKNEVLVVTKLFPYEIYHNVDNCEIHVYKVDTLCHLQYYIQRDKLDNNYHHLQHNHYHPPVTHLCFAQLDLNLHYCFLLCYLL